MLGQSYSFRAAFATEGVSLAEAGSTIIVGGGPAGALLAFLLARGGVQTTLIERHSDFASEFRGDGMTPSGMAAIREAGLWDDFDRLPSTPLESIAMYADRKPFLQLDIAAILPPGKQFIRILAQPHLLEMLIAKAEAFPNFTFMRGVLVREPIVETGRVRGVRLGEEASDTTELRADYVFAADGRYSTMRRRLGLELAGEPQSFDVVWCKVRRPETMVKGRVYSFLLPEFFGLAFPTEDDHVQIGRIIAKGTFKEFRGGDGGGWYDKIAASMPSELARGFLAVRDSSTRPTLLDVVCGSLLRWSVPGLCFIGDAAHPMSPIGAQGINLALRDAIVAANQFGPALLDREAPEAVDAAAIAFEQTRRREVDPVQKQQSEAPRRFAMGRRIAGILRLVPPWFVQGFARWIIGLHSTRNFIEGVSDLRLRFGRARE
jgi:2-polyprenyl-6-methoxyphenol hydroxylase-like FAD-dependent oxidoreductase